MEISGQHGKEPRPPLNTRAGEAQSQFGILDGERTLFFAGIQTTDRPARKFLHRTRCLSSYRNRHFISLVTDSVVK